MKKKAVWLCVALWLMSALPTAVLAGRPVISNKNIPSVNDLKTAYIVCDSGWLTVGKPAGWKVVLSGDEGDYTYRFSLFYLRLQVKGDYFSGIMEQVYSGDNLFTFTAEDTGLYYIKAFVRDGAGNVLELDSEYLLAVSPRDAARKDSVIGIVKSVAALCARETDNTSYGKALYLHDWLISHADYDDTFTEYLPDGVLLKGSGTCQSYAMAYQMLLYEAGVESIFVSGQADGEPHAWNMVKILGCWYHVDVTWDEQADMPDRMYFGLPDALMARIHSWSGGNRYPACDIGGYDILSLNGYHVFEDSNGLNACLHSMLTQKQESFRLFYIGTDLGFDLAKQMKEHLEENLDGFSVTGYRWEASTWEGKITFSYDAP
jgi:hypothetical protein